MARKIVAAVKSNVSDQFGDFDVFCDDGTVWTWTPPDVGVSEPEDRWAQVKPPLPQADIGSR